MYFVCGTNFKLLHQLKTIYLRYSAPLTRDCEVAKFANDLVDQHQQWLVVPFLDSHILLKRAIFFDYTIFSMNISLKDIIHNFSPFCLPTENNSCASLSTGSITPGNEYFKKFHFKMISLKVQQRKFGLNCKRMSPHCVLRWQRTTRLLDHS